MKILVTGAGGCLGGRLVETLQLTGGADYRAMFRNPGRAYRVARFPAEMVAADIADAGAVDSAVAGCDVVVHCAHDLVHPERNVPGMQNLVDASLAHGVRRFVYVSSAMVQEPFAGGSVDESRRSAAGALEGLDETRRAAEERLFDAAGNLLSVVALRPTTVYGPYSPHWTMGLADNLRDRRVVVPAQGRGLCHAVYVDDVVDALLRAATIEDIEDGPYLVSGPAPVTWAEFYAAFEAVLGTHSVVLEPDDPAQRTGRGATAVMRAAVRASTRSVFRIARHERLRPVRARVGDALGPRRTRALKHAVMTRAPRATVVPTERERALYTSTATIDDTRARQALGYAPRFDFDRGMALTAAFLRWSKL